MIIHRGRLVTQEPLATLTARAGGGTVVRSPDEERLADALRRAQIEVSAAEGQLLVAAPAERVGEIAAAAGIVLHELRPQGASLEEVFLELTGGENR